MKIVFTGGGSGGHFYPIIAVAEKLREISETEHYVPAKLYYFSNTPYDKRALFENEITFIYVPAGKMRRYFSVLNIVDFFKIGFGVAIALVKLFRIYPDIVFGKGAYASFPTLMAARILGIPVMIHESDAQPGRVNAWAGKFALRVGISYEAAAQFFPKGRTALTGVPIRKSLTRPSAAGAREFLKLEPNLPVILVLGGSQGSSRINDAVLAAVPDLITRYEIVHQVGAKNAEEIRGRAQIVLENNPNKDRYRIFDYLNADAMAMSAGVASIVISRAGSTAISEIALWGLPSIIVPIPEEVSHDQTKNAVAYARSGASILLEERNLSSHILISEIDRILGDQALLERMKTSAKEFGRPDAAEKLAKELLALGLRHEL